MVFIPVPPTALSKLLSLISAPWTAEQHSGGNILLFCFFCFTDLTKTRKCSVYLCALILVTLTVQGVYAVTLRVSCYFPKFLFTRQTHKCELIRTSDAPRVF